MKTANKITPEIRPATYRKRFRTPVGEESKTVQSARDECNINFMMAQYQNTGQIRGRNEKPRYLDLTNAVDYHQSIINIEEAQDAFMKLPALLRKEFDNDPETFLAALETGEATEALRKAGFINGPEPEQEAPEPPPEPKADKPAD